MEDFIKALVQRLGPDVSAFLGLGALAVVIIPHLLKVWESWSDSRFDKRAFAAERARLELLKLWIEVEALRKELNLEPPLSLQPPLAGTSTSSPESRVDAAPGQAVRRPGVWRWLAALDHRHRVLSSSALGLLTAITLPIALFGAFMVISGFITITSASADIAFIILSIAFESLVLHFLRALYRQHRLLRVARNHTALDPKVAS